MRPLSAVLLASLALCCASGQTYTISTFAGGGLPVNIPGTSASLPGVGLNGVVVDAAGNVFFTSGNTALRLDARTGLLTVVAGNGTFGFSGDNGPATSAQLDNNNGGISEGIAVDSAGNLYIADTSNNRIRKVSNGVITTVAGGGTVSPGDNGPAINAQLGDPAGIAVDAAGNLYIADSFNDRIRKVSNGVITTVAGNGTKGFSGDNGPATSAQLYQPYGVAVDVAGNLYIADTSNNRIRKVSNGVITTIAGNGTKGFSGDNGPATGAQLFTPVGVAVDATGNIYIADLLNGRIRKVSNGVITTVAGGGTVSPGDNGPAINAAQLSPADVAVDSVGNLYIADVSRVRKVSNGTITTLAGNGTFNFSGDGGPATNAQLQGPYGVAVDSVGNLYATANSRVRQVANGVITTVAGGGTAFPGNNGPATSASLPPTGGIAVDSARRLFFGDNAHLVRQVANGVVTTVAGGGSSGLGDNGPATNAQLGNLAGIAVDSAGNLYIADTSNNRIRKVSNGVITTVAGNGTLGFSGDNGPATNAQVNNPEGIAVDSAGNLYIADTSNNRIRKVSNGVITTIAGNGTLGFSGDNGPATGAELNRPVGVAVDSVGNIYIADDSRIRKISNGVITTIAGNGGCCFSGDNGPATSAPLYMPVGVAVDISGNVYIADSGNNRIRLLTPSGPSTTSQSISAVANAASNLSGPLAPGEIVVLFGSGLGPSQLTSAHVGSDGLYDAALAGTSVQFNGIPAPTIYTSATQVAAIVPYEVTGGASAQVTVTYQGQTSAPITIAVAASAPGLFTLDSSGSGQAAAVNQDGSINTPSTPARSGTIISLFATGEGQTSPPGVDGKPASHSPPTPNLPVNVTIGGVTVNGLQYVGGAPGEVAGLLQINVQIPTGIQTGNAVPLSIQIGGVSSQAGVTIAVSGN